MFQTAQAKLACQNFLAGDCLFKAVPVPKTISDDNDIRLK
jgi:hypothetical protein